MSAPIEALNSEKSATHKSPATVSLITMTDTHVLVWSDMNGYQRLTRPTRLTRLTRLTRSPRKNTQPCSK